MAAVCIAPLKKNQLLLHIVFCSSFLTDGTRGTDERSSEEEEGWCAHLKVSFFLGSELIIFLNRKEAHWKTSFSLAGVSHKTKTRVCATRASDSMGNMRRSTRSKGHIPCYETC